LIKTSGAATLAGDNPKKPKANSIRRHGTEQLDNEIWQAVTELFFLLEQPDLPEEEYQLFFERNPCVFEVLGFDCFAPFDIKSGNKLPFDEERGFTPMPDFICGKRDVEEAVVFEIKRPDETRAVTARADGNRAKLRANIEGYVSQTCEYVKSIRGNSDARKAVCQTLEMNRIRSTSGFLLCGMSDDNDAPVVAELISERAPRIQYMYYDKLYNKMCDAYARNRKQYARVERVYEGLEGVHLTVMASISPEQLHGRAYLIDIGEARRNRVSLYVADAAYIHLLDADGHPLEVKIDVEFGVPQIFQIEFSNDPIVGFLSILHNNKEIINMQRQDGYQNSLSMDNMVIGSDRDGHLGACCIIGTTLLRYRVLGIKEKLDFIGWLINKSETGHGLEHNGTQYMRRNVDGNLIQESGEARPILRETLHYNRIKN